MEVDFLFDEQLIAALNSLIKAAKHKLILISPFIDLDERIIDTLKEKITRHDFELKVLFGKNENNYEKSLKRDSMEFLKKFPNIEIRYNARLHAKFYQNDYEVICTSLNLYDYSLANNIEVGIRYEYAHKGLLLKANDAVESAISTGVDKIKQDVLGMKKDLDPIEKFETIFNLSELLFKTTPIIKDKEGIKGAFGYKELDGQTIIENKLTSSYSQFPTNDVSESNYKTINPSIQSVESKKLSASKLGERKGLSAKQINSLMEKRGYINGDSITEYGASKGIVLKSFKGNNYFAYPEDII